MCVSFISPPCPGCISSCPVLLFFAVRWIIPVRSFIGLWVRVGTLAEGQSGRTDRSHRIQTPAPVSALGCRGRGAGSVSRVAGRNKEGCEWVRG